MHRIDCGNRRLTLSEISIGAALQVSRIAERWYEQRLTAALTAIVGPSVDPLLLTVQERYYLLIQYLSTLNGTPLYVDPGSYIRQPDAGQTFHTETEVSGILCRQLLGYQAEMLEQVCEDGADWLTGALVLQCDIPGLPPLPAVNPSREAWQPLLDATLARVKAYQDLPQSEAERIVTIWATANDAMAYHLNYQFDPAGIVILPQGGADDAPARFRAVTALGGFARQLERHFSELGARNDA